MLRHPIAFPIKWSHHQKTLVVDESIAFLGGLDLCYGRWDTCKHVLTDTMKPHYWPGKDYYSPFHDPLDEVHEPWVDLTDRYGLPSSGSLFRWSFHFVHSDVKFT